MRLGVACGIAGAAGGMVQALLVMACRPPEPPLVIQIDGAVCVEARRFRAQGLCDEAFAELRCVNRRVNVGPGEPRSCFRLRVPEQDITSFLEAHAPGPKDDPKAWGCP